MGKEHNEKGLKVKKNIFKLQVKSAYFEENSQRFPVEICHVKFENDGDIVSHGKDVNGEFKIFGHICDDYVYIQKTYNNGQTVYGCGYLKGDSLKISWGYTNEYGDFYVNCLRGNFNGAIIFDTILYNLKFENKDYNIYFCKDDDDCGKHKGVGVVDGIIWKYIGKFKTSTWGKLKMKSKDEQRKYYVDIKGQDLFLSPAAPTYEFQLDVVDSFYMQNGFRNKMDITYLNFENDADVRFEGKDQVGSFTFSGSANDDYLKLRKEYHGKHTINYAGVLNRNMLNLVWGSDNHEILMKSVRAGNFNAGLTFNADLYNLYYNDVNANVFLTKDKKDPFKYVGLGLGNSKCMTVVLKKKNDNEGSVSLKIDGVKDKMKVEIYGNNLKKIEKL